MNDPNADLEAAVLDVARQAVDRQTQRLSTLQRFAADLANRLDQAADAKAAAIMTGQPQAGASVVYDLRAFARELREAVGRDRQEEKP